MENNQLEVAKPLAKSTLILSRVKGENSKSPTKCGSKGTFYLPELASHHSH